jgi:predicted dehydrogenase
MNKIPQTVKIGQIGCGYWGPNLLRNFSNLPNCIVKTVVDNDADRRQYVKRHFPSTDAVSSVDVILKDSEIDGVVISTPAATHFELARSVLEAGKHVFVEKPLATHVSEVDELEEISRKVKKQVMVGHTFLFNGAVRYIRKMIENGELGEIRYIYSQRLNLGRIRSDIDALWNFAPHDISIIQYLLGDPDPIKVARHGMDFIQSGVDDVVFLNIQYSNKVIANIHVSWLDPQKCRKMVIVGSRKMVVYDDVSDDKIAIFDKGIDRKAILGQNMDYDRQLGPSFVYRSGGITIPHIPFVEPLKAEAEHFVDCIINNREALTGISHAKRVVSILEKASS